MGKSSPTPPATPDYTGAAQATAQGNKEAAQATAESNRVNQYTPYGNLTYNQTGTSASGNPLWSATQTLSPAEQQKYDSNNALSQGLLNTAQRGLGSVNELLSNTRLDESRLARPGIQGQAVQDAIMSRLRPELDRQQSGLDNQLANQGIMRDSEAYNTAQERQSNSRNDLMTQAALQGINTGQQARQQGIQEQYAAQSRPLDIINALRTGNQVQNPSFVNVPQQANTAGADLLGAQQGNYNAQMGQYNAALGSQNAMTSGLMGLGGSLGAAGIMKYGLPFAGSDRSIKEDIHLIGRHPIGVNLYAFDYKPQYKDTWGHGQHVGVMADEVETVMPQAVYTHPDGYKMVDYGMIGH